MIRVIETETALQITDDNVDKNTIMKINDLIPRNVLLIDWEIKIVYDTLLINKIRGNNSYPKILLEKIEEALNKADKMEFVQLEAIFLKNRN